MSYTEQDMVAAAEAHHRAATTFLTGADSPGTSVEWQAMLATTALAEATAGLLAMELAKYAESPGYTGIPESPF